MVHRSRGLCALFVLTCWISMTSGQVAGNSGEFLQDSSDELFAKARELAFSGKRAEARQLCRAILEKSPEYVDARLLLGQLFAWDGNYDAARTELEQVVSAKPGYIDARDALVDVERWSGNHHEALRLCDEGLQRDANSETLLYKKALVLESLNDTEGASETVRKLLLVNPAHSDGLALRDRLDRSGLYKATLDYSYDRFDENFEPWHSFSLSLSRRFSFGPVIGRVNYARRFSRSAVQYEVDAYPRIRSGTYAYLNTGFSASPIFPRFRFGGEVYQTLPNSFEASLGVRHLRFTSSNVTIYTGSVGKYYGNYWLSFRPYITPSSVGASQSAYGSVRRYFEDAENYITFIAGAGSFPDERSTTLDTYRLRSARVSVDARKRIGRGLFGSASFGFDSQETGFGTSRKRVTLGFSLEKFF